MLFLAPISLIMSWPRRALGRCSPLFHLYVNFWIIWRLFILMFSISWLVILCGLFSSRSPRWRAATRPRSWIHTLYIHYLIISIRYSVNANWFCLSVRPERAIRPLWPVKRLVFFKSIFEVLPHSDQGDGLRMFKRQMQKNKKGTTAQKVCKCCIEERALQHVMSIERAP